MTCERKLSYLQFGGGSFIIWISSFCSLKNNRWHQIIKGMVMQSALSDMQHAARHYSIIKSPLQNTPKRQRWATLNKEFRYLRKSYDQLHYVHVHVHLHKFGRLAWKNGCLALCCRISRNACTSGNSHEAHEYTCAFCDVYAQALTQCTSAWTCISLKPMEKMTQIIALRIQKSDLITRHGDYINDCSLCKDVHLAMQIWTRIYWCKQHVSAYQDVSCWAWCFTEKSKQKLISFHHFCKVSVIRSRGSKNKGSDRQKWMHGTCLPKYGSSLQPLSHTNLGFIIKEGTINNAISEELGRMFLRHNRTTLAELSSEESEHGSIGDGGRAIVEGHKRDPEHWSKLEFHTNHISTTREKRWIFVTLWPKRSFKLRRSNSGCGKNGKHRLWNRKWRGYLRQKHTRKMCRHRGKWEISGRRHLHPGREGSRFVCVSHDFVQCFPVLTSAAGASEYMGNR